MLPAFLFAALALLPVDAGITSVRVDAVECNAIWSAREGDLWSEPKVELSLRQLIFWQGDHVTDWRIDKGQFTFDSPNSVTWIEGDAIFRVTFGTLRRTDTDFDPETEDRAVWPNEKRTPLRGPRK